MRLYLVRHLAERLAGAHRLVAGQSRRTRVRRVDPRPGRCADLRRRPARAFRHRGWDPRGTGRASRSSTASTTTTRTTQAPTSRPTTTASGSSYRRRSGLRRACADNNGDILQFVGTNSSARDIDAIRRALGEDEISYLGFSYGSELGGAWATLFPETVRAAVFDSAADPTAERPSGRSSRRRGSNATLATFLAACSADPNCPFHNDGDAEGAFDELMSAIDETPLPTVADRPPLTRGMALDGVAEAMYSRAFWPQLARALAAAQRGDGGAAPRPPRQLSTSAKPTGRGTTRSRPTG